MGISKARRASPTAFPASRVKLGSLDGYIGFNLRLAQNASFKSFQKRTGESDLRPGWFAVLALIHHNPGITPMALSRASGRDKSTLTPVLRDLLRRKLVSRRPTPNDKRSYLLDLTKTGEEKLSHLTAHALAHDRALDEIVGNEKEKLIRLLQRITALID